MVMTVVMKTALKSVVPAKAGTHLALMHL